MSGVSRRGFLGQSAATVGGLALAGPLAPTTYAARKLKSGADQVVLGRTGIKTSLIGMGTGSTGVGHSSNQVKLGEEKFVNLVHFAFDRRLTYFDTPDQYGSHIYPPRALEGPARATRVSSRTTRG